MNPQNKQIASSNCEQKAIWGLSQESLAASRRLGGTNMESRVRQQRDAGSVGLEEKRKGGSGGL